jgi:hypothetical protein
MVRMSHCKQILLLFLEFDSNIVLFSSFLMHHILVCLSFFSLLFSVFLIHLASVYLLKENRLTRSPFCVCVWGGGGGGGHACKIASVLVPKTVEKFEKF